LHEKKRDVLHIIEQYTTEIAIIMAIMVKDRELYMLKRRNNLNKINGLRDKIYTLRNG